MSVGRITSLVGGGGPPDINEHGGMLCIVGGLGKLYRGYYWIISTITLISAQTGVAFGREGHFI